jgi:hypothetical protein
MLKFFTSSRTDIFACVMQEVSHLNIASNGMGIEMFERSVKVNTHVKYLFRPKPPIIGCHENMLNSPLPFPYLL